MKNIKSALISVFDKDNLEPIVKLLHENGVEIYSTGGTQSFIENLGIPVIAVEDLTSYPSIFGGRVKTLHPKIFGGILHRRELQEDLDQAAEFEIPEIDLVIVDLYPFEDTVASGAPEQDIIEKIDIGGISLIRAAAKNFKDVIIVGSKAQYTPLQELLEKNGSKSEIADRKWFATQAFNVSSHYDSAIFNYFAESVEVSAYKESIADGKVLRYGENPHQKGEFFGDLEGMFEQLNGKELSYNNLIDVDAAVNLINEFKDETAMAILKHNNACGIATGDTVKEAYLKALSSDPISAFGGVIISTKGIDLPAAEELNKLFCEVIIAPSFDADALELLKSKKNRILLVRKEVNLPTKQVRTLLNGVIRQDRDASIELAADFTVVTKREPSAEEVKALEFANKVCKHTKSNAIVLAVDGFMVSSGLGQTSRVDALRQAIEKAKSFDLSLEGAVMASDAFFPFPDCVEIAKDAGIKAVVQPGGSIKDQNSIDYCDSQDMAMVTTGVRHFKH
ncbi:bifunctional phosphoribosylaminoimidazolecarboxamide formyltransferase/IMP cyclohydrolase [Cyclobacteriaceae bacterium]|nr:bifunctional phosphoribosylaminoimidazolecarboxamide formyltransferase/IMP cyclohydrolase [Cyclobacteriaceae bacterium]